MYEMPMGSYATRGCNGLQRQELEAREEVESVQRPRGGWAGDSGQGAFKSEPAQCWVRRGYRTRNKVQSHAKAKGKGNADDVRGGQDTIRPDRERVQGNPIRRFAPGQVRSSGKGGKVALSERRSVEVWENRGLFA